MRWITIIMVIIVYYFLLGLGINLLLQDEFITAVVMEGNTSYRLFNVSDVNMTTDEISERTTLRTFPSTLKIMFGFRTPIPSGIPQSLVTVLSFINWFLIILFGVSVYRIINPLA